MDALVNFKAWFRANLIRSRQPSLVIKEKDSDRECGRLCSLFYGVCLALSLLFPHFQY